MSAEIKKNGRSSASRSGKVDRSGNVDNLPKIPPKGLRGMKSRFVQYYIQKPVAAWAARKAGYKSETAGQQGYNLLQEAKVREAIDRGLLELKERSYVVQEHLVWT